MSKFADEITRIFAEGARKVMPDFAAWIVRKGSWESLPALPVGLAQKPRYRVEEGPRGYVLTERDVTALRYSECYDSDGTLLIHPSEDGTGQSDPNRKSKVPGGSAREAVRIYLGRYYSNIADEALVVVENRTEDGKVTYRPTKDTEVKVVIYRTG